MGVFISWAGKDRDVKDVIAARLRDENIEYWESDEYCYSDFSSECMSAISRSDVFVVIISEASMDPKSYVISEVIRARRLENDGKLNIIIYKLTDQPLTDRFDMHLNHVSDANHIARIKRTGATGGIDSLITRIKYLRMMRSRGFPELPYDVLTPHIAGTDIMKPGFFVDHSRDDIMVEVEEGFARSNIIILNELYGFGKRSVIRKHVEMNPGRYAKAVEVEGRRESLRIFFSDGLSFTNINDEVFENCNETEEIIKKIDFLKKLDERYLVIVSDIDVGDEVDEFVVKHLSGISCRLVFITQNSAAAYRDIYPVISVGRMSNEYLTELFFHHYTRADATEKLTLIPYLEKFFDGIGGHTKTVEITASVLAQELRCNPDEVPAYLSVESDGAETLNDIITNKITEIIGLEDFDDNVRKTLILAVLSASPTVEEKMLRCLMSLAGVEDFSAITILDRHRWINYNEKNRTIFVEPIIAQVCVKKLLDGDELPRICFEYLSEQYENRLLSPGDVIIKEIIIRLEHFARLMQLTDVAELFRVVRLFSEKKPPDSEYVNRLCRSVEDACDYGFAQDVSDEYDEDCIDDEEFLDDEDYFEDEPGSLREAVLSWVTTSILPAARIIARPSLANLYSFSKQNRMNEGEIASLYGEEFIDEIKELCEDMHDCIDTFVRAGANLGAEDEQEAYYTYALSVFLDFFKRDFSSMMNKIHTLLDKLEGNEYVLQDKDTRTIVVYTINLARVCFMTTGLHQSFVRFCERVLAIDWDPYEKYSFLLMYTDAISSSDEDVEDRMYALEMATDIFDDAVEEGEVSQDEKRLLKRQLLLRHAYVLCKAGSIDEAIEKFTEAQQHNTDNEYSDSVSVADSIVKELLLRGDVNETERFIDSFAYLFKAGLESSNETIRTVSAQNMNLFEMFSAEDDTEFADGGISENRDYYRKYLSETGTGRFAMMKYTRVADQVKKFDFSSLTDSQLREHTDKLRARALSGENKMKLAPEAFALVSEAGMRVLGYRHHYVQYVGAAVMLDGKVAEIRNGEGKTYTIPLVAFVMYLYGQKVFVADNSRYLTERNYNWMKGLYEVLGIRAERLGFTGGDTSYVSAFESDVIYASFYNLIFGRLHNEISRGDKLIPISDCCIIIDEIDTVLIDNPMIPYTIRSNQLDLNRENSTWEGAYTIAKRVAGDKNYYDHTEGIVLKKDIYPLMEEVFGIDYEDVENADRITEAEESLRKALRLYNCMTRDKDYYIKDGRIWYENKLTGALFEPEPEDGYYLARFNGIDYFPYLKNSKNSSKEINATCVSAFLGKFGQICGTSATVSSVRKEFKEIYGMEIINIPTALPVVRQDYTRYLYTEKEYRNRDILALIREKYHVGQPVLVITGNINESMAFSRLLKEEEIEHKLLNALNSEKSPEILSEAGILGSVLVTTAMANRGVDIKLGGDPERMTIRELVEIGVDISGLDKVVYRIPDEEVKDTELYLCYTTILQKNKAITAANKKKVVELGGLCVICTEPFVDMRVEQQARGRCARQGDPGESYVFECMKDEAFKSILGENALSMMLSVAEGFEVIDGRMLYRSLESAKQRIHHAMYRSLKQFTADAEIIEGMKEAAVNFKVSVDDGSTTFAEEIKRWSHSPDVIECAVRILEDEEASVFRAVSVLVNKYRDRFESANYREIPRCLEESALDFVAHKKIGADMTEKVFGILASSACDEYIALLASERSNICKELSAGSRKEITEKYTDLLDQKIFTAVERTILSNLCDK